jgi:hypothetical protein
MQYLPKNNLPFEWLVLHQTGGTDADPQADSSHHTAEMIEQWHLAKGWDGIGYHYIIHKDGTIYAGRPEHRTSAAVLNHNSTTLNIVLTGNFDRKEGLPNRLPTKEQEESFKWLYRDILTRHKQLTSDKVIPHRKLQNKSCYGWNLSDTYGQELAKKAIMDSIPELKDNTPEAKALCISQEQSAQIKQKVSNKEVLGLFSLIKKLFLK